MKTNNKKKKCLIIFENGFYFTSSPISAVIVQSPSTGDSESGNSPENMPVFNSLVFHCLIRFFSESYLPCIHILTCENHSVKDCNISSNIFTDINTFSMLSCRSAGFKLKSNTKMRNLIDSLGL